MQEWQRQGLSVPALDERPALNWFQFQISKHYLDVSSSRPQTFAGPPCRIPVSELKAYFEMLQIWRWLTAEEWLHYCRELDDTVIAFRSQQLERENDKKKKKR